MSQSTEASGTGDSAPQESQRLGLGDGVHATDVNALTVNVKQNMQPINDEAGSNEPMTLQDRWAEVMAAMKWTRRDLIRLTGQSSSLVSQWLGQAGNAKLVQRISKVECLEAVQRESGYRAVWIATGVAPKRVATQPLVAHPMSHNPVQNRRHVIAWEDLLTVDLGEDVWVVLPDDAMLPAYPKGTVMHFSPKRKVHGGAVVLVKDKADNFYCREYVVRSGGAWSAVATMGRGYAEMNGADLELVAVMKGMELPD